MMTPCRFVARYHHFGGDCCLRKLLVFCLIATGPPPKGGSGGLLNSPHRNNFLFLVGMMMSNVARDLTFSQNQPMKSADDPYIGIPKNTMNLGSLR